ncbi:MAG: PBP1A family penicillin-binding protein [bacterium]|nr:PBP1A family penicillin-binding protein [bacterium]
MATRTGLSKSRRKVTLSQKSSKKVAILYQSPSPTYETRPKRKKPISPHVSFLQFLGHPIFHLFLGFLFFLAYTTAFLVRFTQTFSLKSIKGAQKVSSALKTIQLPNLKLPKIYFSLTTFPKVSFKWYLLVFGALIISFFSITSYNLFFKNLPNPNSLLSRDQIISTKIYDRNGTLLYKIYHNENRSLVTLDQVPLSLRQATIAIEDAEFYRHYGFSIKGISRSLYENVVSGRLSGGSTITQQLVKNTLLTSERTWQRKIKEFILAILVESNFSKDEILQMYLNEVGYGGSAYGIEEASQLYFGKTVKDLNLSQAAILAGLPASPTTYSPFGAHPELALERQAKVLQRMVEESYLTKEEAEKAKEEKLTFSPQRTDMLAPHFVMYVKEILVKQYGEKTVEQGGLEVKTSLDLPIQKAAEQIVAEEIKSLNRLHVTSGATLVTKPKTGEILAMVGSKDYYDTQAQGNFNVTTALRQPGSSIKPVNYAVALSMGFTPATIIPDTLITYQIAGQDPYTPRNYDGSYHGNVPLRVALGSSYNIPAVKVLSAMGVNRMIEQGKKMGITTWNDPYRFGLSLTLGGGEVKMTDMATAYGTLANQGTRIDLNPILEVKDYHGRILQKIDTQNWKVESKETAALSPQIAYLLTNILSDNWARTPTFGPSSQLVIPDHTVAVKTGTSNNLKDNWTIGYTPSFLTAVWVGNNDASPMSYIASGVTGASPIWHKIMSELLKDQANEEFEIPQGINKISICSITGTLPCNGCPTREEWFITGTEPRTHCSPEQLRPTVTPAP